LSEVDNLEILIRSSASGTGFATAAAEAKAVSAEVTGVGVAHAGASKEASKFEEQMHHSAIVLGENGKAADDLSRKLGGLQGLMGGGFGMGLAALGATAAVGIGIAASKSAIDNADRQEAATRSLTQAYQTQGLTLQQNGQWIDAFLAKNSRFIDDELAAQEAVATLTRAGYDQVTVQRIANDAVDLAAVKHVSYADAVNTLNLALQGNTRGLRDLGLSASEVNAIMKEAPNSLKDVTKATTDQEKAADALAKAQDALKLKEDELAGKRTLTLAQQDQLAKAHKAVADAATTLTDANNKLATAQNGVIVSGQSQADLLGKVEAKTKDARSATDDHTQATNRLDNAWRTYTSHLGEQAMPALTNLSNKTADFITVLDNNRSAIGNITGTLEHYTLGLDGAAAAIGKIIDGLKWLDQNKDHKVTVAVATSGGGLGLGTGTVAASGSDVNLWTP
jgi:hypothetical protein